MELSHQGSLEAGSPHLQVWVVHLDVLAEVDKGKFKPSSDVGEGNWFSPQALQSIKSQIHEDTQALLRKVDLLR